MGKHEGIQLSVLERRECQVLIVEPERLQRNSLKLALHKLGFTSVTDVTDYPGALEKMGDNRFTHIIFDAVKSTYTPNEFLAKILTYSPTTICIPSSYDPELDIVFDLIIRGARSYLCKPITSESIENAMAMAMRGEVLVPEVAAAKDRNEALAAVMVSALDKVAVIMQQSKQFETARLQVPKYLEQFKNSAEFARTFAKGGPDKLKEALEEFLLEKVKDSESKMGRLRHRLKANRHET